MDRVRDFNHLVDVALIHLNFIQPFNLVPMNNNVIQRDAQLLFRHILQIETTIETGGRVSRNAKNLIWNLAVEWNKNERVFRHLKQNNTGRLKDIAYQWHYKTETECRRLKKIKEAIRRIRRHNFHNFNHHAEYQNSASEEESDDEDPLQKRRFELVHSDSESDGVVEDDQ